MENLEQITIRYQDESCEIHEQVVSKTEDLLYFLQEYPSEDYYFYFPDKTAYHLSPIGETVMSMGSKIKLYHAGDSAWHDVNEVLDFTRFLDNCPPADNILVVNRKVFGLTPLGMLPQLS